MQKLQPKVAKIREKYKDDPATMNQEMKAISVLGGNIMDGRSVVGSTGTGVA